MTQQSKNSPYQYRPTQHEQYVQRQAAEVARLEAQVTAEEQALPLWYSQWFPSQVRARNQRYWQELNRMRRDSQMRQDSALFINVAYVLGAQVRPQFTAHQEEIFLTQASERLRQQMLREEEIDRSRMEQHASQVRNSRIKLEAQKEWLQREYQNLLQQATLPQQQAWLQSLPKWYPHLLPAQGPISSSHP